MKSRILCVTPIGVKHPQAQVTQPSKCRTSETPFSPPGIPNRNSPEREPARGNQELLQGFSCSRCPLDQMVHPKV